MTKTVFIERNKLLKNIPMLLCNEITNVDEGFIEENYELFSKTCEECGGAGEKNGEKCEECNGEGQHDLEPYQYFLCDLTDWDKERLESFGVRVGYSEKLDLNVLPIYDYGTSWSAFSYSKEAEDDYRLGLDETLTRTTVY